MHQGGRQTSMNRCVFLKGISWVFRRTGSGKRTRDVWGTVENCRELGTRENKTNFYDFTLDRLCNFGGYDCNMLISLTVKNTKKRHFAVKTKRRLLFDIICYSLIFQRPRYKWGF